MMEDDTMDEEGLLTGVSERTPDEDAPKGLKDMSILDKACEVGCTPNVRYWG